MSVAFLANTRVFAIQSYNPQYSLSKSSHLGFGEPVVMLYSSSVTEAGDTIAAHRQ